MPSHKQLLDIIGFQTEIVKLGLDLDKVMGLVVERTLSLVGADGAAIELAEGEDMVYRATSGIAASHLGLRLKRSSSLSGLCVQTGDILHCKDSENDARVDRDACRKVGLRSMLVMPLRHNEKTVGVLKAMSAQPDKFREREEHLLGLLSDVIAAAMFFATEFESDDLFYKATHDGLTDLANRSLFMDKLRNIIERGNRDDSPFGVLMIDMDDLKYVNDTFGHRAGDAIILELANRLKRASRQSDTVARLGGDEFAIILTPVDLPEGMEAAIQRLLAEIALPFQHEGRPHQLRASIGEASFPRDGRDIEKLIETADQRMYAIKRKKPGRESAGHGREPTAFA